ncbi:MAG TPA: hypothetical protein VGF75_05340, partial [Candidatus Saccharimonadales bacterium]
MADGTAKSLLDYLDNIVEKGRATKAAVNPIKIAFRRVVQVIDGEDWESVEVKSIDIDDYIKRFENLTNGQYLSETLTTYKSRMTRGIGWYLHFLQTPGWTPNL